MKKHYLFILLLAALSSLGCIDLSFSGQKNEKLSCSPTEMKNLTTRGQEQPSSIREQSIPWISEIFREAEKQFTTHSDASEKCKHDFNRYKLHLANNSFWAVRMFESSEWPKVGILRARTPAFGHFTECTTINVNDIKGQYCMVENIVDFDEFSDTRPKYILEEPQEEGSAWAAMQLYKHDLARTYRNRFVWALCVPSTCTSTDLNLSLRPILHEVFKKFSIRITTNVRQSWCKTSAIKTVAGYYYVKYLISLLAGMVLFSSIYAHWPNTDKRMQEKIIECFSIQKNYYTLVNVTPEREYMLLHLCKFFLFLMIVSIHSVGFANQEQVHDADSLEKVQQKLNRFYAFDVPSIFIFFSGILLYEDFQKSSKENVAQVLMKILKRWLRLFPALLIVILFYAYLLPSLNDGPLWHRMQLEASYCRTNLLPTLLTLPGARNKEMCYPSSWQAAVEFQLFAFSYICLILTRYYKKSLTKIFLFLTIASSIWTFCGIYCNEHTMTIIHSGVRTNQFVHRADENCIFTVYMSTVARFGSHAMGILVAAMASKLRERKYTIPKTEQICGWSTVILIYYLMAKARSHLYELYYLEGNLSGNGQLMHAVYGAFLYYLPLLPLAFLFLIYLVNGFEYLEKRTPRAVVIFSRLTFGLYATNFVVIHYRAFSRHTHTSQNDTVFSLLNLSLPDVRNSVVFSLVLYFLVNAPIQNLVALLCSNTKPKKSSQ